MWIILTNISKLQGLIQADSSLSTCGSGDTVTPASYAETISVSIIATVRTRVHEYHISAVLGLLSQLLETDPETHITHDCC